MADSINGWIATQEPVMKMWVIRMKRCDDRDCCNNMHFNVQPPEWIPDLGTALERATDAWVLGGNPDLFYFVHVGVPR